jgi:hypothetical protein
MIKVIKRPWQCPDHFVKCDDCGRTIRPGEQFTTYEYWDIPGTEFVCDTCVWSHDLWDRRYGYDKE